MAVQNSLETGQLDKFSDMVLQHEVDPLHPLRTSHFLVGGLDALFISNHLFLNNFNIWRF